MKLKQLLLCLGAVTFLIAACNDAPVPEIPEDGEENGRYKQPAITRQASPKH